MKKVLLVFLCFALSISGMRQTKNPDEEIRCFLDNPSNSNRSVGLQSVLQQLKEFGQDELKKYRDARHNTLMHIAVKEYFFENDDLADFISLIRYLQECGIDINEVNDCRESPLYLSHLVENEPYELGSALQGLGAQPVYFSLAPEMRAIKRWATYFCGEYFGKRKKE